MLAIVEHRRVHQPDPVRLIHARELRREMTVPERKLWSCLRNDQLGFRFRRQYGIDLFIVDFACPTLKLAIEVDGRSHDDRDEYDADRTRIIETYGYRVVRFTNDEVLSSLDGVVEIIEQLCQQRQRPSLQPSPRVQGEGGCH